MIFMAKIVCDASPLISLSETCNLDCMEFLTERGGEFLIPPGVRVEIIKNPMRIRKYQFSALRLRRILDHKILHLMGDRKTQRITNRFMNLANKLFWVKGKPLKIVHQGEAECVAMYIQYECDALLIDEKTTKLLVESPEVLMDRMKGEYEDKLSIRKKNLDALAKMTGDMTVLRSAEILAVAAEKGFFDDYGRGKKEALSAGVYALKEAGCSLSWNEIKQYETIRI